MAVGMGNRLRRGWRLIRLWTDGAGVWDGRWVSVLKEHDAIGRLGRHILSFHAFFFCFSGRAGVLIHRGCAGGKAFIDLWSSCFWHRWRGQVAGGCIQVWEHRWIFGVAFHSFFLIFSAGVHHSIIASAAHQLAAAGGLGWSQ